MSLVNEAIRWFVTEREIIVSEVAFRWLCSVCCHAIGSVRAFVKKGYPPHSRVNAPPFAMEVSQKRHWAKTFFINYPLEYDLVVIAFVSVLLLVRKHLRRLVYVKMPIHFCVRIHTHLSLYLCVCADDHTKGTSIILFLFSPSASWSVSWCLMDSLSLSLDSNRKAVAYWQARHPRGNLLPDSPYISGSSVWRLVYLFHRWPLLWSLS